MEITEFEEGSHCFGDYLTINGKDYEDFSEEEVIGFITEQLKNGLNREYFKQKFLTELLIDMDFEIVEEHSSSCEQCGDWNRSTKYVKQ